MLERRENVLLVSCGSLTGLQTQADAKTVGPGCNGGSQGHLLASDSTLKCGQGLSIPEIKIPQSLWDLG